MTFVATLIAADALSPGELSAAADALEQGGCVPAGWQWLDEGSAADLLFELRPEAAREVLEDGAIDVIVQPLAGRQKRLLVADMDSTVIMVECIDELADYAGLKAEVAAVTERAMRGELDFEAALDARVALLRGLDAGVTMRARGGRCVLVSGGFTRFAEPVGCEIGFDRVVANELLIEDGRLTGAVKKPVVGADAKLSVLRAEAEALGLDLSQTLAVGDGANDLPMIQAAGLGVAYRAKPIVAAAARARVEHGDLTALLWAQGIPRAELVS
jgi:phosphoserine phosphatase